MPVDRQAPILKIQSRQAGSHKAIESIAANNLPGRAALEADEHFGVVRIGPDFRRKGLVNLAYAGMGVNGCPDGFARLFCFREQMRVDAYTLMDGAGGAVQGYVISPTSGDR